jgi:hypothetical protein
MRMKKVHLLMQLKRTVGCQRVTETKWRQAGEAVEDKGKGEAVLMNEALLEEALGLSMAKARAEVAFGATWGTGVRIGNGGS